MGKGRSGRKKAGPPTETLAGPSTAPPARPSAGSSAGEIQTRQPIYDSDLGKVQQDPVDDVIERAPDVDKFGVYQKADSSVSTNKTRVALTNYVKVNQIPQTLYVYSLNFHRPTGTTTSIEYSKRRDILSAFEAFSNADALQLNARRKKWASDGKSLWCTTFIEDVEKPIGTITSSTAFEYTQANGETVNDLCADATFTAKLENIQDSLRNTNLADLPEYIRALNAYVAQSVEENQVNTGKDITRIGANRFYLDRGYVKNNGLRIQRGYFTSIRPGEHDTLLNINPATSAFLQPILVSQFIREIGNLKYADQLLHGARLKITYTRSNYANVKADYNSEAARLKEFVQFGKSARQQKFYKFLKTAKDQPRQIDPADDGTTVYDYFRDQANVEMDKYSGDDLRCVNVGKRVETNLDGDETAMREQSLKGAQWIPACLLQIKPGQMVKATLEGEHTRQMIRHALRYPAANAGLIEKEGLDVIGVKRMGEDTSGNQASAEQGGSDHADSEQATGENATGDEVTDGQVAEGESTESQVAGEEATGVQTPLARMGIDVDDELLEVPYEYLPAPLLRYDGLTTIPILGKWNLRDPDRKGSRVVKFKVPTTIRGFHLLELPNGLPDCTVVDAHSELYKRLGNHNLTLVDGDHNKAWTAEDLKTQARKDPNPIRRQEPIPDHPDNFWYMRMFCRHAFKNNSDCGLIVIPEHNIDLYAQGKRLADFAGRKILFAIGSKFKRDNRYDGEFLSNLALKINLKMGGENHNLDANELNTCFGKIKRADTIVLGADVGHGGVGTRLGSPSVACVVGSIDGDVMRYPGSMRLQAGGQEIIEEPELSSMVKERLRAWFDENNKKWPTNMLFYRDGISESQFTECKSKEIAAIKRAYKDLAKRNLKLTFVICGKRHNTRFYAMDEYNTYNENLTIDRQRYVDVPNGNIPPGSLVTEVVTNPTPFNFFLQSHRAIKGTARSAHYHVLQDEMGIGNKMLPRLTMKLCYAFSRATTGVSYVAPAYIADRLCERGRIYLREWTLSSNMEPKFEPQPGLNTDRSPKRMTKERMNEEKQRFARELARNPNICGKHYKPATAEDSGWENPWDPNLGSRSMFWM